MKAATKHLVEATHFTFSSDDENSIEKNVTFEDEQKKRSPSLTRSPSAGSNTLTTTTVPKVLNSRASLNLTTTSTNPRSATNSPPSRSRSTSSAAALKSSTSGTKLLVNRKNAEAANLLMQQHEKQEKPIEKTSDSSDEKKRFKRRDSSNSNNENSDSSIDEETRMLIERENDDCNRLESQAEFIIGALKEVKKNRESVVMISDNIPFFDQKLEFCVTEPSSGCNTPTRRISNDISAKMTQDLNDMRKRLDYQTQQMQDINNNYLSIQQELAEIKKAQSSSCGGSGGCLF